MENDLFIALRVNIVEPMSCLYVYTNVHVFKELEEWKRVRVVVAESSGVNWNVNKSDDDNCD